MAASFDEKYVADQHADIRTSDSISGSTKHIDEPVDGANDETGSSQILGTTKAPPRQMQPFVWVIIVVSLLMSMLLFSLDNVIVADIQPAIIYSLGNIDKLPWISVGYALGATAVNLFVAKMFVSFDNKLMFISGVVIFEVGSVICGAAPNMTALIFGRVICGVGCTGLYVGNINLLSAMTTEKERPLYISFTGLMWGVGTILGPVIGGAFADGPATWRWCFYLNLCVGAVVAPVYLFLLPSHCPLPNVSITSRVRKLDWVGGALFAGFYVCLITPIAFGGTVYAWSSAQTIALLTVAGVLGIALVIQQTLALFTSKEHRLVPFNILGNWEMQIFHVQTALSVAIVYVPMYFIPLYFQFVRNETALHAAIRLLPFVSMNIFGTIFVGVILSKYGVYMPWYLIGGSLSVVGGSLLYATVDMNTSPSSIYGYSVLCGLGSGLFSQASFAVAQTKVPAREIPLTVAFIGWGQISGIVIALTVSNSVFLNRATNRITTIIPDVSRATVQNAITGADSSFLRGLSEQERVPVLAAIVDSINDVYGMVIAAGALAVVLSLFMKRERVFIEAAKEK